MRIIDCRGGHCDESAEAVIERVWAGPRPGLPPSAATVADILAAVRAIRSNPEVVQQMVDESSRRSRVDELIQAMGGADV